MGRAPCCDKSKVKRGPWSQQEDAMLKSYIELNGTGGNWIALPQKIGLKRCGKSCRLRWLNYLRPNIIHGDFSEAEDRRICELYVSIGSRWSVIAAQLPGRTDNDIKNYWNTKLKKKLLGPKKVESPQSRLELPFNQQITNSKATVTNSNAIERMQIQSQLQGLHIFYNSPALWPKSQLALCYPEYSSNGMISSNYDQPTIKEFFQEEFSTSNSNLDLTFDDSYNNVDCLQGINRINVHNEMNLNCYDVSGFYDKSPTSFWNSSSFLQGESLFQEYAFGNNNM